MHRSIAIGVAALACATIAVPAASARPTVESTATGPTRTTTMIAPARIANAAVGLVVACLRHPLQPLLMIKQAKTLADAAPALGTTRFLIIRTATHTTSMPKLLAMSAKALRVCAASGTMTADANMGFRAVADGLDAVRRGEPNRFDKAAQTPAPTTPRASPTACGAVPVGGQQLRLSAKGMTCPQAAAMLGAYSQNGTVPTGFQCAANAYVCWRSANPRSDFSNVATGFEAFPA